MENRMTEMICITCPIGCHLQIEKLSETDIAVTGNRCARGEKYAREELLSPKRVVTATCRARSPSKPAAGIPKAEAVSAFGGPGGAHRPRRVPLRTKGAFPKERIPELLKAIYDLELELPVQRGQVCMADALGTGVDVIVTRTM
jgi:CxxC motif-containing protein